MSLDARILRAVRGRLRDPRAIRAVARFSRVGEHAACWLVLGLGAAGADQARRSSWLRGTAVVAGAYALNTALKLAVRRPRPDLPGFPPLIATPTQLSFPSAHATSSFAAARTFGRLIPAAPLYALACALAASRVALGVHYPSDVVAGAALGTVIAQ